MFAPRPLLIMTNADQFGQNASVRSIFDYGAGTYGSFGANGKIRLLIDSDDGPGYQRQKRQASYRFFLNALMGQQDPQPLDENPREVFPPADYPDLRCLPAHGPLSASPAIMAVVRSLAARLPQAGTNVRIRDLMLPWPQLERFGWGINGFGVQRFVFDQQGEAFGIPWLNMRKDLNGQKGMIIAFDDRGKEALVGDPILLEAQNRDYQVGAIDMRGIGELAGHPGWLFAVSLLLGDNVGWKQAFDGLSLLDKWHASIAGHFAALYANGPIAALAASYVVSMRQGAAPEWVVMRNGFTSFRELLDRVPTLEGKGNNEIPYWSIPFNALSSMDLMHPFESSATNDIHSWILDPLDPVIAKTAVPAKVRVTTTEDFLSSDW